MTLRADEVASPLNSESSSHVRRGDLFIAFNAADHSESVILPQPPEGMSWGCLVDTALPFPGTALELNSGTTTPVSSPKISAVVWELLSVSAWRNLQPPKFGSLEDMFSQWRCEECKEEDR
ncbi:hypothetical protein CMV_005435 [Castanea mollissima]|uniref:Isoamylase 1-3-like C-terminal domain-containing protein n=1 Tax=Castanea mollissima TaxID=60419 RepID=A0A8J4RDR4_9ROSI|nr:hypothetical protein CMV_005435 [Castanea mollissima]